MLEGLALVAVAVGGAVGLGGLLLHRPVAWSRVAGDFGLLPAGRGMEGELLGHPVRVRQVVDLGISGGLEVVVGGIPRGFTLGDRSTLDLGDPSLTVPVDGRLPDAMAALDADARGVVRRTLPNLRATVRDGEIRCIVPRTVMFGGGARLRMRLGSLLKVARTLAYTGSVPDKLLANYHSDDVWSVRVRNLDVLLAGFIGEVSDTAAAEALRHPDPRIRLLGARYLRHERTLVSLFGDEDVGTDVRVAAVDLLADCGRPERIGPRLDERRSQERDPAVRAAITRAGERLGWQLDGEAGALTLSRPADGGELSVASPTSGELSWPER